MSDWYTSMQWAFREELSSSPWRKVWWWAGCQTENSSSLARVTEASYLTKHIPTTCKKRTDTRPITLAECNLELANPATESKVTEMQRQAHQPTCPNWENPLDRRCKGKM